MIAAGYGAYYIKMVQGGMALAYRHGRLYHFHPFGDVFQQLPDGQVRAVRRPQAQDLREPAVVDIQGRDLHLRCAVCGHIPLSTEAVFAPFFNPVCPAQLRPDGRLSGSVPVLHGQGGRQGPLLPEDPGGGQPRAQRICRRVVKGPAELGPRSYRPRRNGRGLRRFLWFVELH